MFLSYANPDREVAAEFAALLKSRFTEVFDYRDGDSIPAGENWLRQVHESLARTAVGVVLFSESYNTREYCLHEAERLAKLHIGGDAKVFPVRLDDAKVPDVLSDIEYLRLNQLGVPGTVDRILDRL